jgi:hypothetical protein
MKGNCNVKVCVCVYIYFIPTSYIYHWQICSRFVQFTWQHEAQQHVHIKQEPFYRCCEHIRDWIGRAAYSTAAQPPAPKLTATGICWSVVLLMPSWPKPLYPEHQRPPPFAAVHVCAPPAATAVTETPVEGRGELVGERNRGIDCEKGSTNSSQY